MRVSAAAVGGRQVFYSENAIVVYWECRVSAREDDPLRRIEVVAV